ncbi:hypothetical protein [Pseudomonas sp.]|uniref:hypothetical protein n=1 Tax=Pseudomonas sp. TaxID=306 RepID=UPI003A9784FB
MTIRTLITAAYAFLSFSIADITSALGGKAKAVMKNLKAAIQNPPGKLLIAVGVDLSIPPRGVGFYLRLYDLSRDQVEGKRR